MLFTTRLLFSKVPKLVIGNEWLSAVMGLMGLMGLLSSVSMRRSSLMLGQLPRFAAQKRDSTNELIGLQN